LRIGAGTAGTEHSNKIVAIAFQIYKVTSTVSMGVFTREEGSVDAFDEVIIALQPVIAKYTLNDERQESL